MQPITATRNLSFSQAICEATDQALQMDPSVIVIGQGTRDQGAIFGSLAGLFDKYGPRRVIEMPLSEAAVAGICLGAALNGFRPLLILQRADFLFLAMDQILNHAAKWYYMFGGHSHVPITIRSIIGKGWGQGPQHSQSLHALCSHFPGIRVTLPSSAYLAKGLLLNSIFSNDPTILFEARPLFDRKEEVPDEPYLYPFGKARVVREGFDLTIVAASYLVQEAQKASERLSKVGITVQLIDLVSTSPIDYETICQSVKKTARLLILDISWKPFGLASEISAEVNERLFGQLKTPIERMSLPFWPAPTAAKLEDQYYPNAELIYQRCCSIMKS